MPPSSSWLEKLKRCAVQSTGQTHRAGAACHNSQCSIQSGCKPTLLVLISALMLPLCPLLLPITSCCCRCRRLAAGLLLVNHAHLTLAAYCIMTTNVCTEVH